MQELEERAKEWALETGALEKAAPVAALEEAPAAAPAVAMEAAPAAALEVARDQGNHIGLSKILLESPDGMHNCTSLVH